MKPFRLLRKEDASGVSGIGYVAEGVQFQNGKCVLAWLTEFSSVAVYDDIETLEKIHGHGGRTTIEWEDRHPTIPAPASGNEICLTCQHVPMTDRCPFRCLP